MYNRTGFSALVAIIGFIAVADPGVAYAQSRGPCNIHLRQSARMLTPRRRLGWCRRSYRRGGSNWAPAGRACRLQTLLIGSRKAEIGSLSSPFASPAHLRCRSRPGEETTKVPRLAADDGFEFSPALNRAPSRHDYPEEENALPDIVYQQIDRNR